MEDTEEVKISLLDEDTETEEYERVTEQFLLTLPNANILKVQRIQNKVLWRRYFNRSRLMREFDRLSFRQELLFHGTRNKKPELIYGGGEGFDMRFSSSGLWGRGNYFAENSKYSDSYAHHVSGARVMFAALVLTGNSIQLPENRSLTKPPFMPVRGDPGTAIQHRYDSVCGITGGTHVYITYDNDHAYPAYLITYESRDYY